MPSLAHRIVYSRNAVQLHLSPVGHDDEHVSSRHDLKFHKTKNLKLSSLPMLKFGINFWMAFDKLGVILQWGARFMCGELLQYWQFLTDFYWLCL